MVNKTLSIVGGILTNNESIKRTFTIGLIILLISFSIIPSTQAIVYIKSKNTISNSNTLYVGGFGPGNYTYIQDAINNADNGDTVFVYDDRSPYHENLIVNKSINLIGENRDTTFIDGLGFWDVVYISADWVKVSGFHIRFSGDMFFSSGIDISSNYTSINNNYITSNRWAGICIWGLNNTVKDNFIYSNFFYGICILVSNSNTITGNNISNHGCGIGILISNTNTIINNNISNNVYGILLNESSNNIISYDNILLNNNIGIILKDSNSNSITGNTIKNCECGIELSYSRNNIIQKNNFLENKRHAFFENCKNKWKNNYWNRPRLLPKPIIGAISINLPWPFQDIYIRWINFDLRPALRPYDI